MEDESEVAVLEAPVDEAPPAPVEEEKVNPLEPDLERWEYVRLDPSTASELRILLRLPDDAPIPPSILKTITDFCAFPNGAYIEDAPTGQILRWLILVADQRYPVKHKLWIRQGATVFSSTFNKEVIFVRNGCLGQYIINNGGEFHHVPAIDLLISPRDNMNGALNAEEAKAIILERKKVDGDLIERMKATRVHHKTREKILRLLVANPPK